jgi:hypothetical protein
MTPLRVREIRTGRLVVIGTPTDHLIAPMMVWAQPVVV